MKSASLFFFLLFAITTYGRLDSIKPKSKITDVTVFFKGAQVDRLANLTLKKGQHLLLFNKLPQGINPQSIQVKSQENIQILSVVHQLNYKDQAKKSLEEETLFDKIESQKVKMKSTTNQIGVQDIEERLLLENSKVNQSENSLNVQELSAMSSYYNSQINHIRQKKLDLMVILKNQQDELESMYQNLNRLVVHKRKTYSQILVRVECAQSQAFKIPLSYYIASAGWESKYDFRVESVSQPLKIVYQADVFQSTGEDWKNVQLTLSSGNPSIYAKKPELKRYYLGEQETVYDVDNFKGNAAITGRVFDSQSGDALPFCNVMLYNSKDEMVIGATTDFDGLYTLNPIEPGKYTLKISYIGFKTIVHHINLIVNEQLIKDVALTKGTELSEVVVEYSKPLFEKDNTELSQTISRQEINKMAVRSSSLLNLREARNAGNAIYVDGVKSRARYSNIDLISNSLKNTSTDLNYQIDIPFTVLSDGENYNLKIKEKELDVTYKYFAVPKIEQSVFLTAQINNWTSLNLLSGNVSIYYEGTFTSESYLNAKDVKDTLELSLGRDMGINISRKIDDKNYKKKGFGRTVKESVAWKITIRNKKEVPIKILIEDQYPLTKRDDIKVELNEAIGAKNDKKEGILSWDLEIHPDKKKELNFSYTAEYPR